MKKSAFSGFDHPQAEDTQPDYIAAPLRLLAIPIRDCHPDPANARTGHAIDRIAASLAQFSLCRLSIDCGYYEMFIAPWPLAGHLSWLKRFWAIRQKSMISRSNSIMSNK